MSGVSAEILGALLKFDLITEEQADAAYEEYVEEWHRYRADAHWWNDLATLAWKQQASWWEKLMWAGIPPSSWKLRWIEEKRGF